MERLIEGIKVSRSSSYEDKEAFCDVSLYVKKGHEECGDSGFVYCDNDKAILGVFDGVSGEPGAASASSVAAAAVLGHLKKQKKATEAAMKQAISIANSRITHGLTTAAIAFLEKNGKVIVASVGDSPIYSIDGGKACAELPIGRPVKDNDSLFKFLYFRNLVTSVLGPSGVDIHVHMRSGALKKGQMLILATDGLSDNLYIKVKDGIVKESSGAEDLGRLIAGKKAPASIVKHLAKVVAKRISGGRKDEEGMVLVPKQDDIAIAVLRRI